MDIIFKGRGPGPGPKGLALGPKGQARAAGPWPGNFVEEVYMQIAGIWARFPARIFGTVFWHGFSARIFGTAWHDFFRHDFFVGPARHGFFWHGFYFGPARLGPARNIPGACLI